MLIFAPWTAEQVMALNEYQVIGKMHPFTCPKDHDGTRDLVASKDGWHCTNCNYTQNWAHHYMARKFDV